MSGRSFPPPPPPKAAPAPAAAAFPVEGPSSAARKADPVWTRTHARMITAYLPTYATEVLRGPEEYDYKFLIGGHHIEWGDAANDAGRILALASRDHGKSHFWCFAYPLWMADRRAPGRIGYVFSATQDQARNHLSKIRAEVVGGGEHGEANPRLAHLLPLRKDSASEIIFANGSTIRARGFGSKVRGGHPFWIVCDDVGNDEWIWSDRTRTKGIDYYLSAIEPMCVPGGQIVVVGTPFHAKDLYWHLDTTGAYKTLRHPAIHPETGRPLWPRRYPLSALAERKKILGSSIRWSREYLCQPISDEASIFPSWLFDAPGIKQPYPLGLGAVHWRQRNLDVYMGVDLALSSSAAADYFVAFVLGVDAVNGDRYVIDIVRRKGLGYQDQVNTITSLSRKYGCGLVFCESNQFQRIITDMVVRESDVPIKAFYTTGRSSKQATTIRRGMKQSYSANKNALDQGIPGLRMLLENGKLKIPWDPSTREVVQEWIGEMQAFGFAEGKLQGVGAHDDTVLALWMADRASSLGGSMARLDFSDDGAGEDAVATEAEEDDLDFFGSGAEAGDDWRPKEGVGVVRP